MNHDAATERTQDLMHEYIEVPAHDLRGLVVGQRPARHGSDDAIEVLVQFSPEKPEATCWFHLEPKEYVLM